MTTLSCAARCAHAADALAGARPAGGDCSHRRRSQQPRIPSARSGSSSAARCCSVHRKPLDPDAILTSPERSMPAIGPSRATGTRARERVVLRRFVPRPGGPVARAPPHELGRHGSHPDRLAVTPCAPKKKIRSLRA